MNNEENLEEQTRLLMRLAVAIEKIEGHLAKLSSTVLTVEDQRGNDYKAVATTKID
jgi:hypothetical protein